MFRIYTKKINFTLKYINCQDFFNETTKQIELPPFLNLFFSVNVYSPH